MMLLWSPHSAGSAKRVVSYLLSDGWTADVAGRREVLPRDPAPELLEGDGQVVAACIDALETRHRYTCATLSFAPDELELVAWIAGDRELRRRIEAAVSLWKDLAWAGISPEARPPVLVGTHLHTGRLEVNILAPRAILREVRGRVVPRAWNPHPPTAESRALWTAYQDAVNQAFGWQDPGDPRRAAAIRGPAWIEKRAAALDRWSDTLFEKAGEVNVHGAARVAADDPRVQLFLAARILARSGADTRDALLRGLKPVLADLGWSVDHLRPDAVVFWSGQEGQDQMLTLRGTLCLKDPPAPDPVMAQVRTHLLTQAGKRLGAAMDRRVAGNRSILDGSLCLPSAPPDPMALLVTPRPAPQSIHERLARRVRHLLERIAVAVQSAQVITALAEWAGRPGGGFGAAREKLSQLAEMPPITLPDIPEPQTAGSRPAYIPTEIPSP